MTTTYATASTTHLTKSDLHYSNDDIELFKLRSLVQGEVTLQPGPEWDVEQATNNVKKIAIDKHAAGGYADFQFKIFDIKGKGAGGYAVFRKTFNPKNNVNDIFEIADMKTGGCANFLNANILENAKSLRAASAPAPLPLSTTKYLTE